MRTILASLLTLAILLTAGIGVYLAWDIRESESGLNQQVLNMKNETIPTTQHHIIWCIGEYGGPTSGMPIEREGIQNG